MKTAKILVGITFITKSVELVKIKPLKYKLLRKLPFFDFLNLHFKA